MLDLSSSAASYLFRVGRGVLETVVAGSSAAPLGCQLQRTDLPAAAPFSCCSRSMSRSFSVPHASHFNAGDNVQPVFYCCLQVELCFQFYDRKM
jgi:hypothetical protein